MKRNVLENKGERTASSQVLRLVALATSNSPNYLTCCHSPPYRRFGCSLRYGSH